MTSAFWTLCNAHTKFFAWTTSLTFILSIGSAAVQYFLVGLGWKLEDQKPFRKMDTGYHAVAGLLLLISGTDYLVRYKELSDSYGGKATFGAVQRAFLCHPTSDDVEATMAGVSLNLKRYCATPNSKRNDFANHLQHIFLDSWSFERSHVWSCSLPRSKYAQINPDSNLLNNHNDMAMSLNVIKSQKNVEFDWDYQI